MVAGGVLVAVAVLTGAVLQSATGFGFALVAGPALLAAAAPAQALTTLVLLGLGLSLLLLGTERRTPQVARGTVAVLLLAAVPGEVLGSVLLRVTPTATLQVVVGVLVLLAVALQLRPPSARVSGVRGTGYVGSAAVGAVTGAVSTATGVSGPPLVLWLQHRGLAPAALRDSLAATFVGLSASTLVVYTAAGQLQLPPGGVLTVLALLVLVAAGQRLGRVLFARLSPRGFRVVALLVVTTAALASIRSGLVAG